jgi:hypothetical protein
VRSSLIEMIYRINKMDNYRQLRTFSQPMLRVLDASQNDPSSYLTQSIVIRSSKGELLPFSKSALTTLGGEDGRLN